MTKKKSCPSCNKTDQVIPILYGLPDDSLIKKAQDGKVVIGGCLIYDDSPKWFCKRDNKEF